MFLPGHGATTRYFAVRVSPLALHHHLMLVDLLGFGRSPKPWTRYTVDRHVSELHRVLAPRGPLTLVGHSLGARLAVTYAARYPDQVRRLILPCACSRGRTTIQYSATRRGGVSRYAPR